MGLPASALADDDDAAKVVKDIYGQEVPAEFDLDGDGIADLLDTDGDGKPDAEDLNHNGKSDAEEEAEKAAEEAAQQAAEEEAAQQAAEEAAQREAEEAASENAPGSDGAVEDAVAIEDTAEADDQDSDEAQSADSDASEEAENSADAENAQTQLSDEERTKLRQQERAAERAAADYSALLAAGQSPEAAADSDSDLAQITASELGLISRGHVDLTTEKFIASIAEQARYIGQKRNLYASVLIAQAILESGSGNSSLAQYPNFNLFGIKGSYNGNSVNLPTQEDDGTGSLYDISAGFRVYPSMSASMNDYANLLRMNPVWYSGTWKENAKSWKDAAIALQGTYATSTTYASSLASLIKTYDLTQYDEPLPYKVVSSVEVNDEGEKVTEIDMEKYVDLEKIATSFLDTPYVWGGDSDTEGFDCSGLVQWVYKKALGIELPRTSQDQSGIGVEVPIDVNKLRMGDLLFFSNKKEGAYHVAMYLSNGYFIHAPETGDVIKITSLEEFTPSSARRILQFKDVKKDTKKVKKAESEAEKNAKANEGSKANKDEKSQKAVDADERAQSDATSDEKEQASVAADEQDQDKGEASADDLESKASANEGQDSGDASDDVQDQQEDEEDW